MNSISMIVGGTGQFGITLAKKLSKTDKVIITTRSVKRSKNELKKIKNVKIVKLNILRKIEITKLLINFRPKKIFYFAGQSSPALSFKNPKETYLSNFKGCKNFLEVIFYNNLKCKFINSSSCDIYGNIGRSINLKTKKKPISPYGKSKLASFNITKKFRERNNLSTYNAIIFNTESIYRNRSFLIPKICMSAIMAYKKKKKTGFGNLNVSREWNWCPEQCDSIIKFIKKKPQDFILSNGKIFSALKMLEFAFSYFNLDYRKYIFLDKKYLRKKDINYIKSDPKLSLKKKKIYGKKLIFRLINHYLNS